MKYNHIETMQYTQVERYTYAELEADLQGKEKEYIRVYSGDEYDYTHNGLAVLNNVLTCYITEELNGGYNLEMECVKDSRGKYLTLKPLNIIKAGDQLFRIPVQENIQENDFKIKITANHIFYDLAGDFIEDLRTENGTIIDALSKVLSVNSKFIIASTDLTGINTAYFIRESPVTAIYKKILPRWQGELYRDNYNITIKQRRGSFSGVTVMYGKNIQGFTQTLDYSQLITRVYPIGKDGLKISDVNVGKNYIDSPRINDYPITFAKEVSFPDADTPQLLLEEALKLWGTVDLPLITYKVKFIDLSNSKEYDLVKDLIKLELGDTVLIQHTIFNLNLNARVIKVKKNVLTGNVEEIELGQFLPTIASRINDINNQITDVNYSVENNLTEIKNLNENYHAILTELVLKQDEQQVNDLIDAKLVNMASNQEVAETAILLENKINTKFKRIKLGVMV